MNARSVPEDLTTEAASALARALSRLKGSPHVVAKPVADRERNDPTFTVELPTGGRLRTLACLAVPQIYPKDAVATSLLLHRWLSQTGVSAGYPVVIAPFISPQTASLLAREDVGYVDLAGNFRLAFGQVHLECEVPGNPFRVQREVRSLFTPQASRVILTLLLRPGPWTGTQLSDAAGVSVAHTSGLKKALVNNEWVETTRSSIVLTRPEALLDAWKSATGRPALTHFYTTLHGDALLEATRTVLLNPGRPDAQVLLSGTSAAAQMAPFARGNHFQLLATSGGIAALKTALRLTEVSQGANVLIEQADADDIRFTHAREDVPGLRSTDAVSTYLSLWRQGERNQEAAEHLRSALLTPMWRL